MQADRPGKDYPEVAEVGRSWRDRYDRARKREDILLQFAQPVLQQPYITSSGGGGFVLREDRRACLQGTGFSIFNWATSFQGLPPDAHTPFGNQW